MSDFDDYILSRTEPNACCLKHGPFADDGFGCPGCEAEAEQACDELAARESSPSQVKEPACAERCQGPCQATGICPDDPKA